MKELKAGPSDKSVKKEIKLVLKHEKRYEAEKAAE